MARITIASALGKSTLALVDNYISAETSNQSGASAAESARTALMIGLSDAVNGGITVAALKRAIGERAADPAVVVGAWLPTSDQMLAVWSIAGDVLRFGSDLGETADQNGEGVVVGSDQVRAVVNNLYNGGKTDEMRALVASATDGAELYAELVKLRQAPKTKKAPKVKSDETEAETELSRADRLMAAAELVEAMTSDLAGWDDEDREAFLLLAQTVQAAVKAAKPKAA
jgi:hypothetical protein